jgi:CDP-paratose 2-epimerase
MRKVLVTGGCGFIGLHASERFLKEGWEVVVIDNLSREGSSLNLHELSGRKNFSFHKTDICDFQNVSSLISNERPDLILHLAAQVAVTTSVIDPRLDFNSNALGTFNLLEAVRIAKIKPFFIYSSTNKVYGKLADVMLTEGKYAVKWPTGWQGVDESYPVDFYSPYGCSKGAADQYVRDYFRIYNIPTVVLRQSCIYGPRQMGVEDQGWVAWFAIAATEQRPLTLYGNGKQVRDLLQVQDLIDLYIRCYEMREQTAGKVFNCGGGVLNSISLLEYLIFLNELGLSTEPKSASMRPGDQWLFISDNSLLEKVTGWKPRMGWKTGIQEMVEEISTRFVKKVA